MRKETELIIKSLANAFLIAFKTVLSSNVGINTKVGKNTLQGSELANTAISGYRVENDDAIVQLLVNDYIKYIESGRRIGAKMPPVEPIVRWCKKNGIPTDNSTVFLIRRAISRDGVPSRTIMQFVWQDIEQQIDNVFYDKLFESIITDLTKYFSD